MMYIYIYKYLMVLIKCKCRAKANKWCYDSDFHLVEPIWYSVCLCEVLLHNMSN